MEKNQVQNSLNFFCPKLLLIVGRQKGVGLQDQTENTEGAELNTLMSKVLTVRKLKIELFIKDKKLIDRPSI